LLPKGGCSEAGYRKEGVAHDPSITVAGDETFSGQLRAQLLDHKRGAAHEIGDLTNGQGVIGEKGDKEEPGSSGELISFIRVAEELEVEIIHHGEGLYKRIR
jgi:hypothetical protein